LVPDSIYLHKINQFSSEVKDFSDNFGIMHFLKNAVRPRMGTDGHGYQAFTENQRFTRRVDKKRLLKWQSERRSLTRPRGSDLPNPPDRRPAPRGQAVGGILSINRTFFVSKPRNSNSVLISKAIVFANTMAGFANKETVFISRNAVLANRATGLISNATVFANRVIVFTSKVTVFVNTATVLASRARGLANSAIKFASRKTGLANWTTDFANKTRELHASGTDVLRQEHYIAHHPCQF
jgi:hypothetical protein